MSHRMWNRGEMGGRGLVRQGARAKRERVTFFFSFHFHQATFQWPEWDTKWLSLELRRHWDGNSHDNAHFSLSFVICGKWSGSLIHGTKCLHIREAVVSSKRKGAVWQKLHALQKDVIHPELSSLAGSAMCWNKPWVQSPNMQRLDLPQSFIWNGSKSHIPSLLEIPWGPADRGSLKSIGHNRRVKGPLCLRCNLRLWHFGRNTWVAPLLGPPTPWLFGADSLLGINLCPKWQGQIKK